MDMLITPPLKPKFSVPQPPQPHTYTINTNPSENNRGKVCQ